ncbi:hypothetical protein ACWEO2_30165 [Nocardia sp. NPDC004278]
MNPRSAGPLIFGLSHLARRQGADSILDDEIQLGLRICRYLTELAN